MSNEAFSENDAPVVLPPVGRLLVTLRLPVPGPFTTDPGSLPVVPPAVRRLRQAGGDAETGRDARASGPVRVRSSTAIGVILWAFAKDPVIER